MAIVKYKFCENVTLKPFLSLAVVALFAFSVLLVLNPVVAAPNENASDKGKENAKVKIPEHAVEIAAGVFHLGKVISNGEVIEGIAIFHHRPGHNGGPGNGGNGEGNDEPSSTCFSYMTATASKWKKKESWVVNAQNSGNQLNENFVFNNLQSSMQKWEDASANIFGKGSQTTSPLAIDLSWPTDDTNEVYFADIESDGAIAVTTIWFTSRGNQILEWDMVFDDFNFLWSENGEESKMDFENIAMHELGHAAGLGHPDDSCIDETMFRFASLGETKKQDLHDGDIAGINTLY